MEKYEKMEKTFKPKRLSNKKKKRYYGDNNSDILPMEFQGRLHNLFKQIEKEFEKLHQENVNLHERLDLITEKYETLANSMTGSIEKPEKLYLEKLEKVDGHSSEGADNTNVSSKGIKKPSASQLMSQKLKTYKASTSKIVSSFKIPNNQGGSAYCQMVRKYLGHKDGIWEVACKRGQQSLIGTASADRTTRIWNVDSGQCLISYQGHNGSVNSIRFHPTDLLVCTGSGDGTCHIWKLQIPSVTDIGSKSPVNGLAESSPVGSGDDEQEEETEAENQQYTKLKTPNTQLIGHEGPIASTDWWSNGTQIFTASWDRTVKLWDLEKAQAIHTLEGHESEITHASAHSIQKLIVTSSSDTTFRLWDFRLPSLHSVNVFQGHTDTVTSAVFSNKADHVVSGSDDRTVKVWDLKNMRSPITTIRLDSSVNRLSVSPNQNIVAIPHDNRQVRLYYLSGNRYSRLPRRNRQGHQRIVCATSWFDDNTTKVENSKNIHLLTAGFDKQLLGWNILEYQ